MARTTCPVSVVIPAYNAERFLRRAVESVLEQTVQPLEIIVVDDGSTDGTADVARSFRDQLRYFRQRNTGVAAARNQGIAAGGGDWIAFLDADDCWLPRHLEQCWGLIEADPSLRWCCGAYKSVDRNGCEHRAHAGRWQGLPSTQASSVMFFDAWLAGAPMVSCGMVIHRDVFRVSGMFDPNLRRGEDRDLWYRIALSHPRMGFVWPPTVLYLYNEESLTALAGDEADRLLEMVARNVDRAKQLEQGAHASFERLLRQLAKDVLMHSLNRGRTDVLRRLSLEFGELLSPTERFVAWCGSRTPSQLLQRLAAVRVRIIGIAGRRSVACAHKRASSPTRHTGNPGREPIGPTETYNGR